MEDIATDWLRRIEITRSLAKQCPHYMEVRYEELVLHPESVLERICQFIDLPYETGMHDYYLTAHQRISEHEDRLAPDGSIIASKEDRRRAQLLTSGSLTIQELIVGNRK
ncbi:MAG: putative Sulfotransferase domain superfamily [Pedosphaera sp.]|nr:putative Sulfotransferase domain superfamily [Pedosphaera sp.]